MNENENQSQQPEPTRKEGEGEKILHGLKHGLEKAGEATIGVAVDLTTGIGSTER